MPLSGWYPDPGGRPGHYRYWDGQSWAETTSTSPGGPPGPDRGAQSRSPRRGRARWGIVLAAVAAVLVLVVVGALVVRDAGRQTADGGPAPSVTSGGADASPNAEPTPDEPSAVDPTPVPSETASAAPSPSGPPCPVGNPFSRQDYERDDRVHGGGLSFPRQPGWQDPGPQASAFTWAYDLGETDIQLDQTRFASYAVGAVSVADGFEDPRTAAELMLRCTVASALYSNVSGTTTLVDEETTVDGYRAWTLRTEVRAYDARTSYQGDTVQIVVVDLDSPEALAFFWGSAPIGSDAFTARLDQAVEQLQVG
ncbi:hypothetical protein GCM10022197_38790 [Microlunatus spumicola]|uniref:DUF2510 domain-containing protein n=1 Tax=Microlunatus spumicola TaxID=81499 RepID=A0ABP6Y7B8_9ACTN